MTWTFWWDWQDRARPIRVQQFSDCQNCIERALSEIWARFERGLRDVWARSLYYAFSMQTQQPHIINPIQYNSGNLEIAGLWLVELCPVNPIKRFRSYSIVCWQIFWKPIIVHIEIIVLKVYKWSAAACIEFGRNNLSCYTHRDTKPKKSAMWFYLSNSNNIILK